MFLVPGLLARVGEILEQRAGQLGLQHSTPHYLLDFPFSLHDSSLAEWQLVPHSCTSESTLDVAEGCDAGPFGHLG
ncbi:hypothetical protein VTI74DRAFT_1598 [Chaetomium olivicolor]